MNDKEHNAFQVAWRNEYIRMLEKKEAILKGLLGESIGHGVKFTETDESVMYSEHSLSKVNREIELHELKIKLNFEKQFLADWTKRAEGFSSEMQSRLSEAEQRMDEIIKIANENSSNERIANLLKRYEASNKNDAEEREVIYASLKVALQQLKIIN